MAFEIRQNQTCRAFDLVLDDVRAYRHMMLMIEFGHRGIARPRPNETGPNFVNGKRKGTYHVFFLSEEVADEYVARMTPEPTDKEIAAKRKFMGD